MTFSRYRLWQRSHLLPSTDSFCSSNSQSLLPRAYATGANSHFVSLSFQSVTNCPDCKSFVLKFMQHAGGGACVYPLSSFPQVSPLVTRHSPLTHAESTLADTPQLLENATTLSLLECALTEVSVLNPFRMNTYKKTGEGVLLCSHPLPSERLAQAHRIIAQEHWEDRKSQRPFRVEYEVHNGKFAK